MNSTIGQMDPGVRCGIILESGKGSHPRNTSKAVSGKLPIRREQSQRMELLEVVTKRSVPGILVFDQRENLVFCNPAALDILTELSGPRDPSLENGADIAIRKEIYDLYRSVKANHGPRRRNPRAGLPSQASLFSSKEIAYGCRAFFLKNFSSPAEETFHILIMIEKIVLRHDTDLDIFKNRFELTDRQMEIVKRLLTGSRNKEIATRLCVCEDTIKVHLKHIMKRLGVHSRTEILSMVFQSQ